MKSTYKLLGVIYDKLPETKLNYIVLTLDDNVQDITIIKKPV